jgi:hypothetical protein
MSNFAEYSAPTRTDRRRRRLWLIPLGLLLLGCCAWSGLGAWFFAPLTSFSANRLSYVQGKAEVIAPAQWHPGGILSPDGRYMVTGWTKNDQRESFVWNLVTDEHYPLNIGSDALCWLNPELFVALDSSTDTYYVVLASNAIAMRATTISVKDQYGFVTGLRDLQARWQTAEQLYILDSFGVGAYTILTLERGHPYVYGNFGSGRKNIETVEALTHDLPHVRIPDRCSIPPIGAPLYSPDGRFYVELSTGENAHVLIYTRAGELVAEAYKEGWDPRLMGWAHDSSGVYFQMLISGGAASVFVPDEPIFKLSPLTAEEARSAPVWSAITWGGALAAIAVVGMGWWLLRRRAARRRNSAA